MKKQKGFIQIPILILIVIGIAVIGGAGYFIVHKKSVTTNSQIATTNTNNPDTSNLISDTDTNTTNNTNDSKNITNPIETQNKSTIDPIDVCTNISGTQISVPAGMSADGTICSVIPPIPKPKVSQDCNKKDFKMALVFVAKDMSDPVVSRYKEKLTYIKNRFPWAFSFATGGLATMSIPDDPIILDSTGLVDSSGAVNTTNTIKKFYETSGDDYDFVSVFTNAGNTTRSNYHSNVINNIKGIGLGLYFSDLSRYYGSSGRLMGVNYLDDLLDIDTTINCYQEQKNNFNSLTVDNNCGMWVMLHETAHQWGVYAGDAVDDYNPSTVNLGIKDSIGHYYYGLTSPKGTRDPLGGMSWEKVPNSSVVYLDAQGSDVLKYHPFSLYFMGILPQNEYDTKFDILQHNIQYQISPSRSTVAMESVYKQVSVRDIIETEGPRECIK